MPFIGNDKIHKVIWTDEISRLPFNHHNHYYHYHENHNHNQNLLLSLQSPLGMSFVVDHVTDISVVVVILAMA